jgi:hypothetical protein
MRALVLAGLLACAIAGSAAAQDRVLDLAYPQAVADTLKEEGYKAEVKKHKDGTTYIESAANGATFTVEFFGCDLVKGCASAQFFAWYEKKPWYSLDMANRWNANKRFIKIVIDKDGDLSTFMDVSTFGKVTYANFADSIDWWSVMSGELAKFLDEEEAKAAPPAPAKK